MNLSRRTIEDADIRCGRNYLAADAGWMPCHSCRRPRQTPLTEAKISALVASAVTPDELKAKDDAAFLKRVEAQLLSVLEAVRQARGR